MNTDQTFRPDLDKLSSSKTTTAIFPSFRLASSLPITCAHEHASILLATLPIWWSRAISKTTTSC